ncbi:hypothetical protein BC828DRAFT_398345 [Blastocladiella britannica]|nr:hypothetical protein BC828DRAFT_398345 [Blastocladiella britannica]
MEAAVHARDLAALQYCWAVMLNCSDAYQDCHGYCPDLETVAENALRGGDTRILDWLASADIEFWHEENPDRWQPALEAGQVASLAWGTSRGYIDSTLDIGPAIASGQLQAVEWLVEHLQVVIEYESAITSSIPIATRGGHLATIDWWWSRLPSAVLPPSEQLDFIAGMAFMSGSVPVVEWWWQRFLAHRNTHHRRFGDGHSLGCVFRGGSLAVVEWVWEKSHQHLDDFSCGWTESFRSGNPPIVPTLGDDDSGLQLLEWWYTKLKEHRYTARWIHPLAYDMSTPASIEVLDWLQERKDSIQLHWSDQMYLNAIRSGRVEAAQWVWDHLDELPAQQTRPFRLAETMDAKKFALVQWWEAHDYETSNDDLGHIGQVVAESPDLIPEAFAWWCSRLEDKDPSLLNAIRTATNPRVLDALHDQARLRGIDDQVIESIFQECSAPTLSSRVWWDALLLGS